MTQYEFTHQYEREQADFYIDPPWCSEKLFEKIMFKSVIHDPACGTGNIIKAARAANLMGTANDIVDRGFRSKIYCAGNFFTQDYLKDTNAYYNIVTNPPYNLVEEFAHHALKHTRYKIAILARLAFLEGQQRYKTLYTQTPPTTVLVFSKRPSMPPPGVPVGGGKTAYCWLIWDKEDTSKRTTLDWII